MREFTLRHILVLLVLALFASALAVHAQSFAPLGAPDADARRWAARSLSNLNPAEQWPAAWVQLETGSLDEFMSRAADYTRVFPSPALRLAAVVTWTRLEQDTEVTARLSLRDASGTELTSFAVEPLMAFDVSDDGRVVAHGELMSRLIQCGALKTNLIFYSMEGRELARVEREDFSPGYSTAVLSGLQRFVLGVTGRVVCYDLVTGSEVWTRTLAGPDDRPQLSPSPDAAGLAILVTSHSGPTRILVVDAAGAERATVSLEGRVNPGSGLGFEQDLLVVQEIQNDVATYHLFDPRTLRNLRSIRSN